ncbi:hypothetical protein P4131_03755 [Pseudomonas aeruginosa]|nr:hypothetical protein [Pseudomonas aeruginosa]
MSAASFLGISALVFTSTTTADLLDTASWSAGRSSSSSSPSACATWAVRRADVASTASSRSIRTLSACGSLVVVAFYLIAQMVGAGKLIELLFGLNYHVAVVLVGMCALRAVRRHAGDHLVQIIKPCCSSAPRSAAIMVLKHVNFDVSTLFSEAIKVHPKGEAITSPGGLVKDPISAFSPGLALMFGTAGCRAS